MIFDYERDFAQQKNFMQKGAAFLKLFQSQCDKHSITQL